MEVSLGLLLSFWGCDILSVDHWLFSWRGTKRYPSSSLVER